MQHTAIKFILNIGFLYPLMIEKGLLRLSNLLVDAYELHAVREMKT